MNFNYAALVQQGEWAQLVAIWYRHRNCMAHSGGCLADDPEQCDRIDPRYVNCKAARDEAVAANIDHYRRVLRDTVGQCLQAELA